MLAVFFATVTLSQHTDSTDVYSKLRRFANKRKITKLLFESVFKEKPINQFPAKDDVIDYPGSSVFAQHEGCIVRNIYIQVHDPFGLKNLNDTTLDLNFFQRAVNRVHFTTRKWVIENKLLFQAGKPLVPLELSESERAIRYASYVNDAFIFVKETADKDSVDVFIEVIDKWAVTMPIDVQSTHQFSASFRNRNLCGVGQYFEQNADINFNGSNSYAGRYSIENIDHSYVSGSIFYRHGQTPTIVGIDLQRPSFSPLIRWAGGIYFEKQSDKVQFNSLPSGETLNYLVRSTYYDTWLVRRFRSANGKSLFSQSTGYSVGVRTFARDYQKRPPVSYDLGHAYFLHRGFLSMANIYIQQFYKEKYIYRFGASEDVPVGLILQLTHGLLKWEQQSLKNYFSLNFRGAHHFQLGYFNNSITLACFFGNQSANEVVWRASVYFFSKLFYIKKWGIRQFFHFDFSKDANHNLSTRITLKSSDLYSIPMNNLEGYARTFLNLETVIYAPYDLVGFRFAPVILIGSGGIDINTKGWKHAGIYHALALGILFRNENLLNSTFQISAGYYPVLPDGSTNRFTMGPVTSFTLRVNGFSVLKPDFAEY